MVSKCFVWDRSAQPTSSGARIFPHLLPPAAATLARSIISTASAWGLSDVRYVDDFLVFGDDKCSASELGFAFPTLINVLRSVCKKGSAWPRTDSVVV